MKKVILFILIIFYCLEIVTFWGCANIIPPGGGPRDSIPPVLMNVQPHDSTPNFNNKRIVFTFDEFVELNNVQEKLVVSPLPKISPEVESHLRTVTVRLRDTLEPNTTYSLNFGNAIRDINEGNELKNFIYIFSTGTHFDSLGFSGKVILAETGKPDSTLIVMLHKNLEDSAVMKDRPRYFTRLDSSGNFNFRFLPAGTFAVYALKDDGGMKKYLSPKQLFGFADKPVQITQHTPPVILYAYSEVTDDRISPAGTTSGKPSKAAQDKNLRIQANLENSLLDLIKPFELNFSSPLKTLDTARIRLTNEGYEAQPGAKYILDSTKKKLTIQYKWPENRGYKIILEKDFAEDSTGRKIFRTDTLSFKTKRLSDYGSLKLRFLNLDLARHPVLQFVQNNELKYSHIFTDRNVNIPLFAPGDYELRILYDENQNAKWDPGEFFGKHRQPEKVQPIQRRLNVKANWENEIDITL